MAKRPSPRILLLVALGVLNTVVALTLLNSQELESDTAEPLDVSMATLDPLADLKFTVRKRDGRLVDFDETRIYLAIELAFRAEEGLGSDEMVSDAVAADALSTAFMVLEQDEIDDYCLANPQTAAIVLPHAASVESQRREAMRFGQWRGINWESD